MRKAIKTTALVIVFLSAVLALAFTAGAGMGGFSVEPILPENQDPDTHNLFNLWVTPGMQQEIQIAVNNHRDEPITVTMTLMTAGVARTGIFDYDPTLPHDDSLPFKFEDIATLPAGAEDLIIPPGQRAIIPVNFAIPAEGFDGVAIGAVHVLLGITQEELDQGGDDAMFVSRFASVMPIFMQIEGRTEVEPDFDLGDVYTDVVSHRSAFVLEIHHPAGRRSIGAAVSAQIYAEGYDDPVFITQNMPVEFAPHAIFQLTMTDREARGIAPGNYFARVSVVYGGRTWNFERNFTVTPSDAAGINQEAVIIAQQGGPVGGATGGGLPTIAIIAIVAGLVIIILLLVLLLLKSRKGGNTANNMDLSNMTPPQPIPPVNGAQAAPPLGAPPAPPPPPAQKSSPAADQLKGMSQEDLMKLLALMKEEQNGKK